MTKTKNDQKQIIEINGIKLEVDMRYAKRIDHFKIGNKVKLLMKENNYADTHKVRPGVIVGFENFEKLPTIIVAYMKFDYSEASLHFAHINTENEKVEMIHAEEDYLPIDKANTVEQLDREILKKEEELTELKRKKEYFLGHFDKYFELKPDK